MLQKRQDQGKPTKSLDEQPLLWERSLPYWNAFATLSLRRPAGTGLSGIPTSEMIAWLDLHEVVETEDRQFYVRVISAMDAVWLEASAKRLERKSKHHANTAIDH